MNLTGQQIKDTYEGLLNIGATGLTGSLQTITDGLGNPLPMQVSDTTVNFTGIVTGIVGTTGPAGPTGAQGPIGPTGAAATGGASPVSYDGTSKQFYTCTSPAPSTLSNSFNTVYGNCIDLSVNGGPLDYRDKTLIGSCITSMFCQAGGEEQIAVAIGTCLRSNYRSINIGHCQPAQSGITIGWQNNIANGAQIVGVGNDINGGWAVGVGNVGSVGEFFGCSNRGQNYSVVIGKSNCALEYSNAIGNNNVLAGGSCQNSIGYCNQTFPGSTGAIVIGTLNVGATGIQNAVVIGNNLSSIKDNTVHVPNLIAYGQAASIANAIGSTGTAIAVDWDNSNVQTLTITASGTLTMSNPIDGGVYTLQITQGAGGGHTITWSNVLWPGGTPPSLSITAGAVDILTFIYGPTAYFGNANLNFS